MRIISSLSLAICALFITTSAVVYAQTPATPAATPQNTYAYSPDGLRKGTLANQFDHLNYISKNNYDYKMVRKTNLDIVRKNVLDSVSALKKEIASLKSSSTNIAGQSKSLQDSIQLLSDQLMQEKEKTDSFSFLGMNISKTSYSTVLWSVILVLLISTIGFLFSFRKAKVSTDEYQKTADQAQEELSQFRKKALEKEQILKRQLQDELNKHL